MKQIINGKIYDTDTATKIHEQTSSLSRSDFNYCNETLYMTSIGNFFLEGEGGAMTRYAKSYGNTSTGGSGIQPISTDYALAWCEKYNVDVDIIEKYFDIKIA